MVRGEVWAASSIRVLIYLAVADLPTLGAYFKKEEVMRIGAFVMAGLLALAVDALAPYLK